MLAEGSLAPDFTAQTDTNETLKLSQYQGKIVVLYCYPAAFTAGCTREACGFRDAYEDFLELGADVIGVSIDDEGKQNSFRNKYELPFPFLINQKSQSIGFFADAPQPSIKIANFFADITD